jgi:hypothetical protein
VSDLGDRLADLKAAATADVGAVKSWLSRVLAAARGKLAALAKVLGLR